MEILLSSWFLGRSSERRNPLPRSAYERREGGKHGRVWTVWPSRVGASRSCG